MSYQKFDKIHTPRQECHLCRLLTCCHWFCIQIEIMAWPQSLNRKWVWRTISSWSSKWIAVSESWCTPGKLKHLMLTHMTLTHMDTIAVGHSLELDSMSGPSSLTMEAMDTSDGVWHLDGCKNISGWLAMANADQMIATLLLGIVYPKRHFQQTSIHWNDASYICCSFYDSSQIVTDSVCLFLPTSI